MQSKGPFRGARESSTLATPLGFEEAANRRNVKLGTALLNILYRHNNQSFAEHGHTGEARWTNLDKHVMEVWSSQCTVVGFCIGYGPSLGQKRSPICPS